MANNDGGSSEPAAPACLLVLCGLPGAGKSTLCRCMVDGAPQGIQASHLCFDEVEAELTPHAGQGQQGLPAEGTESAFDSGRWRQARRMSFQRLREALSKPHEDSDLPGEHRRIVLVDDNMHYRSMRRQCYRLARDCRAAYAVLHVACSLEEALRRNGSRHGASRLSPELIRKMDAVMQVPDGGQEGTSPPAEFGQPVLRFSTSEERRDHAGPSESIMCECGSGGGSMAEDKVRRLWADVMAAWGVPPPEPLLGPEAREQLRAAGQAGNAASAAHALDLRCRTAIGAAVSSLAARGCSGAARGRAAGRLNEQRKRVIEACRAASHHHRQQQQQSDYEEDELTQDGVGGWMERLESEEAVFGDLCEELLGCPEAAL